MKRAADYTPFDYLAARARMRQQAQIPSAPPMEVVLFEPIKSEPEPIKSEPEPIKSEPEPTETVPDEPPTLDNDDDAPKAIKSEPESEPEPPVDIKEEKEGGKEKAKPTAVAVKSDGKKRRSSFLMTVVALAGLVALAAYVAYRVDVTAVSEAYAAARKRVDSFASPQDVLETLVSSYVEFEAPDFTTYYYEVVVPRLDIVNVRSEEEYTTRRDFIVRTLMDADPRPCDRFDMYDELIGRERDALLEAYPLIHAEGRGWWPWSASKAEPKKAIGRAAANADGRYYVPLVGEQRECVFRKQPMLAVWIRFHQCLGALPHIEWTRPEPEGYAEFLRSETYARFDRFATRDACDAYVETFMRL